MSALAKVSQLDDSVTSLSANSRLDYIQRFSKQASLVVADETEYYQKVSSQFLTSLTPQHNAAFVAISKQLEDIQVRGRIFEQLFPNCLFDPEQSLAVSLFNKIFEAQEKVAIVVEHGQFLSLQLFHEFSQLSVLAKKAKIDIKVLITGTYASGYKLAENRPLFKDKLTVLDAESGQVVALTSSKFKAKNEFFKFSSPVKFTLVFAIIASAMLAAILFLFQQKTVVFSDFLAAFEPASSVTITEDEMVMTPKVKISDAGQIEQASSSDIFSALTNPESVLNSKANEPEKIPAKAQDILAALSQLSSENVNQESSAKVKELQTFASEQQIQQQSSIHIAAKQLMPKAPYFDMPDGFVVQYGAFAAPKVMNEFTALYSPTETLQYQRYIGERKFTVLTSQIFASKAEANVFLANLSQPLKARGIWVKSNQAIISEINHFQASHL